MTTTARPMKIRDMIIAIDCWATSASDAGEHQIATLAFAAAEKLRDAEALYNADNEE